MEAKNIGVVGAIPESKSDEETCENAAIVPTGNTFQRYIDHLAIINFCICLQAAWEGMALTFQFAWFNGGPAALVYGCILSGIGSTAVALALGEMASMIPNVGAQYRWSARFAQRAPAFWGFMQGWITTMAWMCNVSASMSVLSNTVYGLIIFNYPDYKPKAWHPTLILIGFTLTMTACNFALRSVVNPLEKIGGVLHVVFFVAITAVLVAISPHSTNEFVFKTLTTQSGWENAEIAWSIGLLTTMFPISSFDSVLHMIDETHEPRKQVPRAMLYSTIINSIMMFAFSVCLLYCIGDTEAVTASPLPLVEIFYSATRSKRSATALVLVASSIVLISCFNVVASVSRLVWAFARDGGLPFAQCFVHIHPTLQVPIPALLLVGIIPCILSLINLGSTVAFNALIALPMIALYISYLIPIVLLTLSQIAGKHPVYGPWRLERWSVPVKLFAICYIFYVLVFLPFPTVRPVTKATMNYAGPVVLGVILVALGDWGVRGRRKFRVPVEVEDDGS